MYLVVNNLYGQAVSKTIANYDKDSDKRYILKQMLNTLKASILAGKNEDY